MIPLSISSDVALVVGVLWRHRRHSLEVSSLQHDVEKVCWSFWYFLTISFTCVFRSSSSSYSVLRQTFGVVGASGNSEIESDFSNTNLAQTDGLCWLICVGCLSTLSEYEIEFSLSTSSVTSSPLCSSNSIHSVVSTAGIVMNTLGVCTARISVEGSSDCCWASSTSHLWFRHSVTSRRSLKCNKNVCH